MNNKLTALKQTFTIITIVGLIGCNSGTTTTNNLEVSNLGQQQLTLVQSTINLKQDPLTEIPKGNLNSITKGNNVYAAVGNNGYIVNSTDGNIWNQVNLQTSQNFHAVVFNNVNNLFYAVGDNGTVISSPDATNWSTYKSLSPLRNLYSAIVVNGKLVIGASNSTIFEIDTTSPRGLVTVLTTVDNMNLISAAGNNDLMILGSDDGSILYKKIANAGTSAEWLRSTKFADTQINNLIFESFDSWFVSATSSGQVNYSTNGISWSAPVAAGQNASLNAIGIDPLNGEFLGIGSQNLTTLIFNSNDFNSWSSQTSPVNLKLNDLKCFGNNDCFIVGESGTILTGKHSGSASQLTWTPVSNNKSIVASGASYSNNNGTQDVILLKDNYKTFILQKDSNLVCYGNSGALWASKTNRTINTTPGTMQMLTTGSLQVMGDYTTYLSATNSPGAYIAYNLQDHTVNIVALDGQTILMKLC